ncbi:MAG: ROK family protein [Clostridia bacterium]|nr:ROK family protein [Clostridia bacterium]
MLTGIDIGGTKCAVVLADNNGKIIDKIKFPTTSKDETLANIFSAIEKLGAGDAVGISCGGPLNSQTGLILSPPNLPGWDNLPICRMVEDRFSVPCGLQNDANACAMAEWKFGAGMGTKNMIFLTFGTGLGAGLILGGKLYSGTNDMAGECGHIRLSEYGPVGFGKAGSFEGFCSGGGIAQLGKLLAQEKLQVGETVGYCKSYDELETITAKSVAEAADAGDKTAIRVYEICGEKLGYGLSILIDLLNPERIVIGSVFERSGHLLRDKMEQIIKKEALPLSCSVCTVVSAKLGDRIGDYAALAVAADTLERGR